MQIKIKLLALLPSVLTCSLFRHLLSGGVQQHRGVWHRYDLLLLFSFLAVVYTIYYYAIRSLYQKSCSGQRHNILFVAVTLLVMVLPLTKISESNVSRIEQRSMNPLPHLVTAAGFNYKYGAQYEAWLSDHFRWREKVLGFHSRIESFFAGRAENDRAVEGLNNWLFYKGDNSIANFQNRNNLSDAQLAELKRRLEAKRDYCRALGTQYYVLIAPDKNQIYGEYFPNQYRKTGDVNRGKQVYEYLRANSDIKIVYPADALLHAKKNCEVYYQNDTHWNSIGAFYGYAALFELINADFPNLEKQELADFAIREEEHYGDLQGMLQLADRKYKTNVAVRKQNANYKIEEKAKVEGVTAEEGRPVIFSDGSAKYKVVVFRDSFSSALIPYLSQQFGHVEYFWTRNFEKNKRYVEQSKPDIVIEECVERLLDNLVL